jgi:hypothetical protein
MKQISEVAMTTSSRPALIAVVIASLRGTLFYHARSFSSRTERGFAYRRLRSLFAKRWTAHKQNHG